ncbi:MAG: class I SAM-dependent methyltransferase, partial [Deltaproteobacteria bacterium]|nr:class I SAM-dependent methyltransferase [Deltaproteobacteria bacterium]
MATDYYSQPRAEMLEFVPEGAASVLDVGCGDGAFGASLKARGVASVWGVELNPKAARAATARLDRVFEGGIEATLTQLPDGRFDCITMNDVLEHLVDPYALLAAIKAKLAPGGVLVASIPNVRYLYNLWNLVVRRQWRYEDAGVLDRTHLRFFTKSSIEEMFDEQGFELVALEPIHELKS